MLGIIQEVKQYADYENMIAEWISRRLRVVLITLTTLWVACHRNLHFFSYIEFDIVSKVFEDVGHQNTIVRCLFDLE